MIRGFGGSGELNSGHTSNLMDQPGELPSNFTFGARIVDMSCGGDACCAVLETGKLKCWGLSMSGPLPFSLLGAAVFSQLGYDQTVNLGDTSATAGALPDVTISNVTQVAVGTSHTCAIALERPGRQGVFCWGKAVETCLVELFSQDGTKMPR